MNFSFVLVSNNCLRSIRVSVSSSPYENEFIQKIETQSPSYSSIISNFFQQNFDEQTKGNEEEQKIFCHRPLLHLINQFNRENTFLQSQNIQNKTLPSKQFSSFRPVILQIKYHLLFIYLISFRNQSIILIIVKILLH